MSDQAKKGWAWALERLGLPTVFCVALGAMVWNNNKATREDYVSMRDQVIAKVDALSEDFDGAEIQLVEIRGEISALQRVDDQRDRQVAQIQSDVEDNEDDIGEMKTNRFTEADGEKLEAKIDANTTAINQFDKRFAELLDAFERLSTDVRGAVKNSGSLNP